MHVCLYISVFSLKKWILNNFHWMQQKPCLNLNDIQPSRPGGARKPPFFAAEYRPLQPVVNKIKKKGYFINYDCHSDAPFCHWPPPFVHGFAVNESSISDELMRVQPKTQNPWINEAMHVSHCAASPQTARQSMTLLLFLAKVEFVVYWIWHAPLWENFKGTS